MTGLVALAKALILALSVRMRTGTNLAVATIAQFQKAAAEGRVSDEQAAAAVMARMMWDTCGVPDC